MSDLPASAQIYNNHILKFYDFLVHGISDSFIWRCPKPNLVAWYRQHLRSQHLDIGPGSGLLLRETLAQHSLDKLLLLDVNPECLIQASANLTQWQPQAVRASIMQALPLSEQFESIGLGYILHCIAGTPEVKGAVLQRLDERLTPNGVLFGATILSASEPFHSATARRLMGIYNQRQIFANQTDTLANLETMLQQAFQRYEIKRIGSVALFAGWQ
ncbi:class I SAM-dependent methyltransferase [Herpetosiphon geysericola]|uniref:Methyltransferase type 12 domain-containing protein n=1 Tax=Herpetosiphon geysericola TaxID=70996 RepID=A0A0N8GS26_9CHLR|nr:class I SAM-dependent methyltransferase [Herpetosiphon geysericola]KPL88122.1 hypothetical protein SE18_10385 [Herpetosiphon geysericola]